MPMHATQCCHPLSAFLHLFHSHSLTAAALRVHQIKGMASSSENDAALAQLKHMHDRGIISLNELIRMSADLARPHSPTHEESSRRLWSDDDEDDLLVDESGEAFCAQVSTSASPRSPARASTPTPTYGPRTWGSGTEVQSSEYGDVTFIRLGNDADFVNNGRARIQCEKIKKGAKYKKETHTIWVKADTLSSLDDPVGIASNECSPRKSPRLQQQASAGFSSIDKESSLPCRASIERERIFHRRWRLRCVGRTNFNVRRPNRRSQLTSESSSFQGTHLSMRWESSGAARATFCRLTSTLQSSPIAAWAQKITRQGTQSG
jgi:hypothetical protein